MFFFLSRRLLCYASFLQSYVILSHEMSRKVRFSFIAMLLWFSTLCAVKRNFPNLPTNRQLWSYWICRGCSKITLPRCEKERFGTFPPDFLAILDKKCYSSWKEWLNSWNIGCFQLILSLLILSSLYVSELQFRLPFLCFNFRLQWLISTNLTSAPSKKGGIAVCHANVYKFCYY